MPAVRNTPPAPGVVKIQEAVRATVREEVDRAAELRDMNVTDISRAMGISQARGYTILKSTPPPNLTMDTLVELAAAMDHDVTIILRPSSSKS